MISTITNSIIGVDLGGTKVAAANIKNDKLGKIIKRMVPSQSDNPQDVIDVVIEVIEELMDETVLSIGIGVPGLVDKVKGVVYEVQNIPSWNKVFLVDIIKEKFGVPVYLDNDANCYAIGEHKFGNGKDVKDFVGITLGTGMGGGIIKDGVLMADAASCSGEFGNIPYLDSIYEDYCSGKYFIDKYKVKGERLAEMAAQGDSIALKAFDEFGTHFGNAITTIIFAVNPKKIIVGGSVAQTKVYFEKSMWLAIKKFPFPYALDGFDVIFSDIDGIAILGAGALCLQNGFNRH